MFLGPIVYTAATIALFILAIAFLLAGWRVIAGPTLPDRVLALDTLSGIAIGFIAVVAVKTGFTLYIDIAIALGLVGFLATVAFARFVLSQGGEYGSNQSGRYERKPEPSGKRAGRRKGKGDRS
ncbi:cation:proton antiporter [Rhizobium grahamii]|uniref:Cation:proton antiporter n=1 Tax=Rhizobium grahamii TaxID=1120045 RepID=A0A5Q0C653_9HYPH|nr:MULTISPECIES: cation:proton antiporter [Rhizobium]QFY59470.1 cation:proton antiporter [Rhizobium grahamii]QRM48005.1 cation:proton antiporter [Rhizobium sp. BG6]